MSREIMQQALDHLVSLADDLRRIPSDIAQTIAALEAALAQPEQSKYSDIVSDGGFDPRNKFDAQPEQEPVAWLVSDAQGRYATIRDPAPYGEEKYEPLYTAPPKPEPKSISTNDQLCAMLRQVHDVLACTALPMKRPWVGLTNDEVAEVERWVEFKEAGSGQIVIGKLVRYIELKLRSKNNAV